jgi:hypothetical protein
MIELRPIIPKSFEEIISDKNKRCEELTDDDSLNPVEFAMEIIKEHITYRSYKNDVALLEAFNRLKKHNESL